MREVERNGWTHRLTDAQTFVNQFPHFLFSLAQRNYGEICPELEKLPPQALLYI